MTPDNIKLLHEGEEKLRAEALRRVGQSPDMTAHLQMVERSMNLIHALLPSSAVSDADQLMIGNLGIRIFNSLAASMKLALSGYYQSSAMQLRDILETAFLLDYFSMDGALVTKWRTMSEADRKKEFGPVKVRTALDDRDGFTEKKRAEAYALLSRLAGHATPEGVVMLVPDKAKTTVHCGPFLEDTALFAVISEAAKLAMQAAQAFRAVMKNEKLEQMEYRIDFMEAEADWTDRFLGRTADRHPIAEMRALFEEALRAKRNGAANAAPPSG